MDRIYTEYISRYASQKAICPYRTLHRPSHSSPITYKSLLSNYSFQCAIFDVPCSKRDPSPKYTGPRDNTTRNSPARQIPPTWQATSRIRLRTHTPARQGTGSTLRARRGAVRLPLRFVRAKPYFLAVVVGQTWPSVLERGLREILGMGEGGDGSVLKGEGGGGAARTLVARIRGVCGLTKGSVLR